MQGKCGLCPDPQFFNFQDQLFPSKGTGAQRNCPSGAGHLTVIHPDLTKVIYANINNIVPSSLSLIHLQV